MEWPTHCCKTPVNPVYMCPATSNSLQPLPPSPATSNPLLLPQHPPLPSTKHRQALLHSPSLWFLPSLLPLLLHVSVCGQPRLRGVPLQFIVKATVTRDTRGYNNTENNLTTASEWVAISTVHTIRTPYTRLFQPIRLHVHLSSLSSFADRDPFPFSGLEVVVPSWMCEHSSPPPWLSLASLL